MTETTLQKKISIIIPVYNQREKLRLCLDAVQKLEYTNYEVIVVNDASTDGSDRVANGYNCKVIRMPRQMGAAHARHEGFQHISGDIVAYIDSDCIVPTDYLNRVCEHLRPDIGGVGGTYRPYDKTGFISIFFTDLCNYYFVNKMVKKTDFLAGGSSAFWSDVLQMTRPRRELKYYHKMASGEDVMMCYEISKHHTLHFTKELYVTHIAPDFKKFISQQKSWGFSRTITTFLLLKDKFLNAKDTKVVEQSLQIIGFFGMIAGGLISIATGNHNLLLFSITVYSLFLLPFILYLVHKKRPIKYIGFSIGMMFIRNICLAGGMIKAARYIVFRMKFKRGLEV